tara:strand:- start:393 stop:1451 length:1059 start_codon:yes stop_codon:yes gene_type:complete
MKIKNFCYVLFLFFGLNFLALQAEINQINKLSENSESILKIDKEVEGDSYLLGPGDIIEIKFFYASEFDNTYLIYNDGTVHLPLVGKVSVLNLSLMQATETIRTKMGEELIRPEIYIKVLEMRPVKVSVFGEVGKPGLHVFPNNKSLKPDLVNAIQKAGGINNQANLSEVNIIRKLPGPNNEYKKATLNLVDLIFEGDLTQNITLFDGDIIKIKKSDKLADNIIKLSNNSLSPETISVTFVGSVIRPGTIQIPSNTPLAQGLMRAGGAIPLKSNTGKVKLIRVNNDGSVFTKKYKLNFNKGISLSQNPPLKEGDLVLVRPNLLTNISNTIGVITDPLSKTINAYAILKVFSD